MTRREFIEAILAAPAIAPIMRAEVGPPAPPLTPDVLKFHPDAFAMVMEPIEWSDWQWTPEERAQAAARLANRIDAEAVSTLGDCAVAMPPVDLLALEEKARRYFARNYYIRNGRLS